MVIVPMNKNRRVDRGAQLPVVETSVLGVSHVRGKGYANLVSQLKEGIQKLCNEKFTD